ncbi:hypothetical protein [Citrobacter farmeri]|uniref:hypothetical protein n=1 Tax=Citrobacter farmeri TaxID=67824 RepID=UPI002A808BEB|nr:hypothetical protein [Citrobacter farmeri]
MGTRHLTCVVKDGNYKVAQYGQWDGYYSGAGIGILNFLRDQLNREKFLANLAQTFQPDDGQIETMNAALKAAGKSIAQLYPSMHRDTGDDILELIQNASEPVPLRVDVGFAADSLFCEYAYVVDFDKNTFEVFEGFNHEPLAEGERFYGVESGEDTSHRTDKYYPVRHRKTYQLAALPTNEEFLSELEPETEDE